MKQILASVLALALSAALLAGCTSASAATTSSSKASSASSSSSATTTMDKTDIERMLAELMENEYSDLVVTAKVEETDVVPGGVAKVEITVSNEGDKTIVYTRGSHLLENPDALLMEVEGLQPIMSKDQLEAMDDSSKSEDRMHKLEAGKKETFDMHVLAAKPNAEFDERTHHVYASDNKYLADLEWDAIHAMYPDLEKAAVGSYEGHAYFTYYVLADGAEISTSQTPTGYSMANFTIKVAE